MQYLYLIDKDRLLGASYIDLGQALSHSRMTTGGVDEGIAPPEANGNKQVIHILHTQRVAVFFFKQNLKLVRAMVKNDTGV